MKKGKIIGEILITLVLVFGLVKYSQWRLKESKDITYVLDISEFHGEVTTQANVNFHFSTISTTVSEALKFGEEAVLSYGADGIKIWSPDPKRRPNMYLYAEISTPGYDYKVSIKDKELIITKSPTVLIIFSGIGFIFIFAVILKSFLVTTNNIKIYRRLNKKKEKEG